MMRVCVFVCLCVEKRKRKTEWYHRVDGLQHLDGGRQRTPTSHQNHTGTTEKRPDSVDRQHAGGEGTRSAKADARGTVGVSDSSLTTCLNGKNYRPPLGTRQHPLVTPARHAGRPPGQNSGRRPISGGQ